MTAADTSDGTVDGTVLVAQVVPDVTGLDKHFDYAVPAELRAQVRVGTVVRVPLQGRRVTGWVAELRAGGAAVAPERLRPIAGIAGEGPAAELVELASWAAHRWASARRRPFLVAASPPRRVRSMPPAHRSRPVASPVGDVARDAAAVLAAGGGVLRLPPTADVVPVLIAACGLGPVLAIVPAAERAGQLAGAVRAHGHTVAVMPQDWAKAAGGVDLVIGARAAAWAPCPQIAAAVVIDEHDEALQEERAPTWHARDVVRERARRAGVPALLVSPCPTVVALGTNQVVRLPPAAEERTAWPRVHVVDVGDTPPWRRSLLSSELIDRLRDPAQRVVCVLNTRGRARLLACRVCRTLQRCERCDAAVSQDDGGTLTCRRCATQRPAVCQACGATALALIRQGVTRLADDVAAAAGRPVSLVSGDRPTAGPHASVVVGTEAALHRVHSADVVAFVDFDAELLAPRYRAAEQAMGLLVRAARLVGERRTGGTILVQAALADHEVLRAAVLADPGRLAAAERDRRRLLGFPPFGALAWIGGPGAAQFTTALSADPRVMLGGHPDDGYLVRASSWRTLADALAATPRPQRRLRIEVDPPRR